MCVYHLVKLYKSVNSINHWIICNKIFTSSSLVKMRIIFFLFYDLLIYNCFKSHFISPHIFLVEVKLRIKSDDFLIIMFCHVDFVLCCTFILCGMISTYENMFRDLNLPEVDFPWNIFSRNEQQSFNPRSAPHH